MRISPAPIARPLSSPVMHTSHRALFAALLLVACDKPSPTPSATPASATATAAATSPKATATTSSASAAVSAAPPAVSAASASASASAGAATASRCAPGARQDDDARYCITLPAKKPLAISYEGDKPSKGIREELEVAGDRLVLTVDAAPKGKTVAQLKKEAAARFGESLVDSGDLTNGYWIDSKDAKGQHIVEGVVVGAYLVTCTHWVRDEQKLPAALAVCRSLTTF
jgi:hypothetical protein